MWTTAGTGQTMDPESSIKDLILSYKNFVHAVAGATGSVVGLTTFYPLDTVRTRLQVDDKQNARNTLVLLYQILKEEGLLSLYRGWFPVISSLCCSNFVYFYVYNFLKVYFNATKDAHAAKDLTLGFISGVVNVLITTPLWVANTRLKTQGIKLKEQDLNDPNSKLPRYKGMIDCVLKVRRQEGVKALWAGVAPSIILVFNPALQFMTYEFLKRMLKARLETEDISGLWYLGIGAVAKAVATVSTYPLQVIQTKQRLGKGSQRVQKPGIIRNLRDVFRTSGVLGLFKGLEAKLLQTILMAALMFFTYEKIVHFVFKLMGEKVKK